VDCGPWEIFFSVSGQRVRRLNDPPFTGRPVGELRKVPFRAKEILGSGTGLTDSSVGPVAL
jgi:hypothetical protein